MKTQLLSFVKGVLAGLAIGLGGFLYVLMVHFVQGELGRVLGSLLFAVGLFTVCTCMLHLYTGKIGMVYEGKQTKDFYISLPVMLIGNAIGAFGFGFALWALFKDTSVMETVNRICTSRTNLASFDDFLAVIVQSTLCGVCVYLAVKAFSLNRLKPVGILLLVFFVFVFVYAGFQHCVANMFYFGFGNHINGYTFINLAFCILFNSLGPVFGVLLVKLIKNIQK